MPQNLNGAIVAITGASSGIGRALALQLAELGCRLAIADLNEEALAETERDCRAKGAEVFSHSLDVSNREAVQQWAELCLGRFGSVNIVINNAGVNLSGSFEATQGKDFEWLMGVNFWGVIYGCEAFLPIIKKASWGHVVNISSLFGLISIPNQSAYNAAKFAVRGFTESLRLELAIDSPSVGITSVHPGGIKTNIVNNARFANHVGKDISVEQRQKNFNEQLARTTAEQAAAQIITAIRKRKPRLLIGLDAKLLDWVQRLFPVSYQKLVLKVLG